MKPRIVLAWLSCLCVLPWLGACSRMPPRQTPPAPTVIEAPIPAYRPLPAALTAPLKYPDTPPEDCLALGVPTVCVLDALLKLDEWKGIVDQANLDRATAAKISAGATKP